jgi:molecular chaperone GrpE
MVGDESVKSAQNTTTTPEEDDAMTVTFPYPPNLQIDDVLTFPSAPTVKIDYTAIEIPAPKKTVSVRRSASETRLVRMLSDESAAKSKNSESAPASTKKAPAAGKDDDLVETMQKLLKSVGAISLATQENQRQCSAIASSVEKQSSALPKLDALQKHLDQSHKVETANQRLFDVMHSELKGYKDHFLFDALQKPVIHDLVTLFDDLCGQTRRMDRFLKANEAPDELSAAWKTELKASYDNISNTVFFIIEVLNRLDVTMLDGDKATLDLKLHKVVGVEPTDRPEEKNQIARVVRAGFLWKDRVLRPIEVIIKKCPNTATEK